jgi:hypothetical protein
LVQGIEDPWWRALALAELAPCIPDDLLAPALNAARALKDPDGRVRALAALATRLPCATRDAVVSEILEVWLPQAESWTKSWVLEQLAPCLPASLQQRALESACDLKDEWGKADALASLAPHLTPLLLIEALQVGQRLTGVGDRVRVLLALIPLLPEPEGIRVTREALETIAHRLARPGDALTALLPYLQGPLLQEAMDALRAIKDEGQRAEALAILAPQLAGPLLREALDAVLALGEKTRGNALAEVAEYLPEPWLREAFEAARAIENGWSRAKALEALAPYLSEPLVREALRAVQFRGNKAERQRALAAVALRLAKLGQPPEALRLIRRIKRVEDRGRALAALSRYLPKTEHDRMLQELLEETHARKYDEEEDRPWELLGFALLVEEPDREEFLREALVAAATPRPYRGQLEALKRLVPYLTGPLLADALTLAVAMEESSRNDVLAWLSPRLADLPTVSLYPLWDRALHSYESSARAKLLVGLEALSPLLARLGGAAAVEETIKALRNVGRWWP